VDERLDRKPARGFEAATGTPVAALTVRLCSDALVAGGDQAWRVNSSVPLLSSFERAALAAACAAAPDVSRGYLRDQVPAD
jgi:glycerophosphoryl diester phosphodiesterase